MRIVPVFILSIMLAGYVSPQDVAQKIFDTEKAFEKVVAEKSIREGFIQFLSPTGVMFMPDAVNGREAWSKRPASPAALTWNPIWIDVSANGVLAYSIGNSQYKAKGADDPTVYYGHYLTVWLRQTDGAFMAALDTAINHEKPASEPTSWQKPIDYAKGSNPDKISAGDSAVGFYQIAAASGPEKAYRSYLADDVVMLRDGKLPAFNKAAAIGMVKGGNRINFAKRKSFTEAIDLAYVNSGYTVTDKTGAEIEKGNFVQVWKFRGGKWLIVADVLVPLPAK